MPKSILQKLFGPILAKKNFSMLSTTLKHVNVVSEKLMSKSKKNKNSIYKPKIALCYKELLALSASG